MPDLVMPPYLPKCLPNGVELLKFYNVHNEGTTIPGNYLLINMLKTKQGSHPTLKTLKTWNVVFYISRPGKCLEFAQIVGKTWDFN